MGSGTFGIVFAAKVDNRSVAIKRFNAETIGQAKIDAAEVAVSRIGCCRLNASQSSTDIKTPPPARGRLLNGRLGSGWGPGVEFDMVFLE